MSTSRHCAIYLAVNGKWYVELGEDEHDCQEDSYTYGPFHSQEAAEEEIDWHSNPGGYNIDDSGTRPVPVKSPNGRPVQPPTR